MLPILSIEKNNIPDQEHQIIEPQIKAKNKTIQFLKQTIYMS